MVSEKNESGENKTIKVGYIRISNPEKQNVASQRKLMIDQGIPADRIFEDYGSGGVEPMKRAAYKEMSIYLKEHPEITDVVMSEYSRLGRTVVESLHELLSVIRRGIKVSSLSQSEKMINDIPAMWQPAVISLMMGSAQSEREHIKERTRWGLEAAKERGKKLGRPIVKIDFSKIDENMKKYNLKEAQAVRVCGYKPGTFYRAKRGLKVKSHE
jgi:putative DNA-invertase from lambdoid prophage Rac